MLDAEPVLCSGRVVDDEGRPVPGAEIVAGDDSHHWFRASQRITGASDEHGRFELRGLWSEGEFDVRARQHWPESDRRGSLWRSTRPRSPRWTTSTSGWPRPARRPSRPTATCRPVARKDALELGLNRKDGAGALLAASDSVSGLLGSVAALLSSAPATRRRSRPPSAPPPTRSPSPTPMPPSAPSAPQERRPRSGRAAPRRWPDADDPATGRPPRRRRRTPSTSWSAPTSSGRR